MQEGESKTTVILIQIQLEQLKHFFLRYDDILRGVRELIEGHIIGILW